MDRRTAIRGHQGVLIDRVAGYARTVFALASHDRTGRGAPLHGADERRRVRLGFAATHPTVVVGLAMGAGPATGLVGVALLALHGLVELHWQVADRNDGPAGIAAAAAFRKRS